MATYNYFDSDKWIIVTKIGIAIVINALVYVPIFVYKVDVGIWIYALGFIINLIFILSMLNARKFLIVDRDGLTVVRRLEQKKYPFSRIKKVRFYYASHTDGETGNVYRQNNVCEISFSVGKKMEIMDDEFEDFGKFKFDLIEAHRNYLENPPIIPGKLGPNP